MERYAVLFASMGQATRGSAGGYLRPARLRDVPRLCAILWSALKEAEVHRIHMPWEDAGVMSRAIRKGMVTVWQEGARAQGFCIRDGQSLHALYVSSAMRRKGVGEHLLKTAQGAATAEGNDLRLYVLAANRGARAFYARMGFHEVAEGHGLGNDEGLADLEMRWSRDGHMGQGEQT